MKKTLNLIFMTLLLLFIRTSVFAVDVQFGEQVIKDPYFQMNSFNLNTMNSYILPTKNDINPETYTEDSELKYTIASENGDLNITKDTSAGYKSFHLMSSYIGFVVLWLLFVVVWYFGVKRRNSGFAQVVGLLFEGIWETFEDILGKVAPYWTKLYVVGLFFIILLSNLLGVTLDILRFAFPQLLRWVTTPSAEFETTLALAIIATIIPLMLQYKQLGLGSFLHEYVPITGKGLLDGKGIGPKIGDIIISLFIGFLDIVGVISKIISLSMRLFGNMSSGSILLNVAFLGLGGLFVGLFSVNLVVGIPIILYIQGLLVSVVQAFVFAMLVSIGIKMSME